MQTRYHNGELSAGCEDPDEHLFDVVNEGCIHWAAWKSTMTYIQLRVWYDNAVIRHHATRLETNQQ